MYYPIATLRVGPGSTEMPWVGSTPEKIRSELAAAFARDQLAGRPRILLVGCLSGEVHDQLAEEGFVVTAVRATELATVGDGFDAIVFSHALSVVPALDATIDHAARLLAPTGRIVVDDLDAQAIDLTSLRWFYDMQELLAAADLYPASRVHPLHNDPMTRWRDGVRAEGVLHTGTEMRVAISSRFAIRELKRVEYLYRHISEGLPADARGAAIAGHLRAVERRQIASDALLPVGLRVVADRAR